MKIINNNKNKIFISIIILIFVCLSAHYYLSIDSVDESFTMSLIKHNYVNIVKIDSFDIHPPLYYILLKLFINITTFWTRNVMYKIIFARLFSLLCLILLFKAICCTLNKMSINYNSSIIFIILIIFSLLCGEMNTIRMYPLAALFVSLEFFEIVDYIYTKKIVCIYLMTIFAILSAYTHDFSALISGLMILYPFLLSLYSHDYKRVCIWLISGVCLIVSYIPWAYVAILQIRNIPATHWISKGSDIKYSIIYAIIIFVLGLPIIYFKKFLNKYIFKIFLYLFNVSIILLFLEILVSVLMSRPIFELRYAYPLLIIYVAVTLGILYSFYYKLNHINDINIFKIKFIYFIIAIFVLLLGIKTVYKTSMDDINNYSSAQMFLEDYIIPNEKNNYIRKVNVNDITEKCKFPSRLFVFNTYAQYNNKILPASETKDITNSKISNMANKGNKPRLRFLVWHTRVYNK